MASLKDPLILPADVLLVPVTDLPEDTRARLDYAEGDVAIARRRSRTPSRIIDAHAAALLSEFRSASTAAEAILRYSLAREQDPRQVLEDAFPLLQNLINAQLLVPADTPEAEPIEVTLPRGEQVDHLTVVSCLQVLQDTELYQARQPDGCLVALKMVRPEARRLGAAMLAREATILRHLDGQDTPAVAGTGEFDGRAYLALQWCDGVSVDIAAQELRSDARMEAWTRLLNLCVAILQAYAHLHAQHVVHSDVHPRNTLVDAAGKVSLLDFGLARLMDPSTSLMEPPRGGVAFFLEPEHAQAQRKGKRPPAAQYRGEQYALAALVYYLLTGVHYLDFSLEKEEMLRQIVQDDPLPFSERGMAPCPAVEQVLHRALSKAPSDRYQSVAAFAAEFEAAAQDTALDPRVAVSQGKSESDPALDAFLTEVLERLALEGPLLVDGLVKRPTASLYYGAVGIAYVLYRIALGRGEPSLLALADVWATRAAHEAVEESAFYNAELDITTETVGRISPYHTGSGIYAVQALIAQAMGDRVSLEATARAFVAAASEPCSNLDLTLGLSSVLVAGSLLVEAISDEELVERSGLAALGALMLERLWGELEPHLSIHEAEGLPFLGMAHGWAGFLYASLRWCQATDSQVPPSTRRFLEELATCAEWIGRGARWPWQLGSQVTTYMPGWCNGSAGYVYLWSLAHRFFGDECYWTLADKAAWNCWEDPAQMANLCCGLAGRSYALLHWYTYAQDEEWLHRARVMANQAAKNIRTLPLGELKGFENSLYKGEIGVAALVADLSHPEMAALPFFASEGWLGDLSAVRNGRSVRGR